MARRFCTVDDVKTYANVHDGYALSDAAISTFIGLATAKIVSFTRRKWEFDSHVEYFDLANNHWVAQPQMRYQSIHTKERPIRTDYPIKISYTLNGDFSALHILPAKDYRIDAERGLITLLLQFTPQRPLALKVEYFAGYDADPTDAEHVMVGEDLRQACAMQAAFLYSRSQNETLGLAKHQDKSGVKEFNMLGSGFIREAQGLVAPHVRPFTGAV